MKETRKLPVILTAVEVAGIDAECRLLVDNIAKAEDEKKYWVGVWNDRVKPMKKRSVELAQISTSGVEVREVECEHRDSLVVGQTEVVRLDTGEVIETYVPGASVDDDGSDPKQPALPFATPPAPVLRCTGIDRDGMLHAITAEQADAVEMGRAAGETFVPVRMSESVTAYIVEVRRGKACEVCGIVAPHHRPECDGMKADEVADRIDDENATHGGLRDDFVAMRAELDDDDAADPFAANDTAEVAAHVDDGTITQLVPTTDGPKLVKLPKRGKKADSAGEVQ